MTTEHVSVPRTVEDVRNWHLHQLRTLKEAWQPYEHHKACAAILSRATPREWPYCPECGCEELLHQKGEHKQCANCYQEYFDTIDYSEVVRGNLTKLFKKAQDNKPSAPRVVTDEDVMRACRAYNNPPGHTKPSGYATPHMMRAALESFVNGGSNE